ncbi:hypothetical protein MY11210_003667 [Beauveria gryllotalpidicola]
MACPSRVILSTLTFPHPQLAAAYTMVTTYRLRSLCFFINIVFGDFILMQIRFKMEREVKSYKEIFRLHRRRAIVSIAVQTMTSLTGVKRCSVLPEETRQQTLEEIAAAFGDDIVSANLGKPGSLAPGIKAHHGEENGTSTDHQEIRRVD